MAAFNYRQLIRQVPVHAWKFYLQSRKLDLPTELADDKLVDTVTEIFDAQPANFVTQWGCHGFSCVLSAPLEQGPGSVLHRPGYYVISNESAPA